MATNQEGRQIEIANELGEAVRTLAHSTRTIPKPSDSYELLGALVAAQEALAQVYAQVSLWHDKAVAGTHYNGVDGIHSDTTAPDHVAQLLAGAAASATRAANQVSEAHSVNGAIRWFYAVKTEEDARP